jgi:hypothetical protein
VTRWVRWSITATLVGLVVPLTAPGTATAEPLASCSDQDWLGVWAAAPSDASHGTDDFDHYDMSMNPKSVVRDETLRAVLTPTFGGTIARVRLSNRFGTVAVTFAQASIVHRASGPALVPDTTASLTFAGGRSVTVAPGQDVLSDPADFSVQAFDQLAVSIHVVGDVGKPTEHYVARQTSYLTRKGAGDHTADVDGDAFIERTTSRPFVSGIEVLAPQSTGAVAALGDSITDGRWPDVLAHRLDADLLSQSGVTTVIWLEGINDLLMSPNATVDELLGG